MKKLKSGKCLTLRAIEMKASTGGGGEGAHVWPRLARRSPRENIYIFFVRPLTGWAGELKVIEKKMFVSYLSCTYIISLLIIPSPTCITQLAMTSFDKIFDLTAGMYFYFQNMCMCMSPLDTYTSVSARLSFVFPTYVLLNHRMFALANWQVLIWWVLSLIPDSRHLQIIINLEHVKCDAECDNNLLNVHVRDAFFAECLNYMYCCARAPCPGPGNRVSYTENSCCFAVGSMRVTICLLFLHRFLFLWRFLSTLVEELDITTANNRRWQNALHLARPTTNVRCDKFYNLS